MNRSVLRALKLLIEVGKHPEGTTATDVAADVGLARATASRLLTSMEYAGFLARNDGNYSLGWQLARLGRLADPHGGILSRVQVTIEALVAELNETIAYAVVTGPTSFDLVAEVDGPHFLAPQEGYAGQRLPLHASAMGKIILADLTDAEIDTLLPDQLEAFTRYTITDRDFLIQQLAEIRAVGYATLDSELEEGLFSVAVGVRDDNNNLIGILTVSGLDQRMKAASIYSFVERLKEGSVEIATALTNTVD